MNEKDRLPEPRFLDLPGGARLAYHRTEGRGPGIVFLGGFASDMTGSKATALEAFARERGQAFLRFDYEGHGASSGKFEEGTIGLWAANALSAIEALTEGPQILVGSSMGGWIMLLAALKMKERVAALVGLAPAPDFTEDLMWATFPPEVRRTLESEGIYREPSDYSEEPYTITLRLIEEGRENLLLRRPIPLTCPVRLIHGEEDKDVPWQVSTKLMAALESEDVTLTLVKGAGHRLSEPQDIARLEATLGGLLAQLES
jgi:pimeloyl-ACP methyl ester carboxylesterase